MARNPAFIEAVTLDELISKLQCIRKTTGNVPVCFYDHDKAEDVEGVDFLVSDDNGGGKYVSICKPEA